MIKEAAFWQGNFPSLYESEIEAWVSERSSFGVSPSRISLSDIDPDNPNWEESELNDESVWIEPDRILIIDNLEEWAARSITQMFKHAEKLSTEFSLALIQRSNRPLLNSIKDAITEKARVHSVPTETDQLEAWVSNWLESHDVQISTKAVENFVYHVGDDIDSVVEVCRALSISHAGATVKWSDIESQLGAMGHVPIFGLMGSIIQGDSESALLIARRIASSSHPLQPLALIRNKYLQYLSVIDSDLSNRELAIQRYSLDVENPDESKREAALKELRTKEYAFGYARKESEKIGRDRLIRSYTLITEADQNMKGQLGIKLDPQNILEMLVIGLAEHFRLGIRTCPECRSKQSSKSGQRYECDSCGARWK